MGVKTKKSTVKSKKLTKKEGAKTGAKTGSREIQIWRKDLLEDVRSGLCYTLKDVMAAAGVSEMVVMRILRGNPDVHYRTLEAVVSSLHLKMDEVFDQEANIVEVLKRVYERAKLNWEVKALNGTVIAVKEDGTPILVSGKQKVSRQT